MCEVFVMERLHPVKHLRIYRNAVTKARDRMIELLKLVSEYPYLESKVYTYSYSAASLNDDKGIRYNAYMKSLMDTLMELFEESHCINFPGNPCAHLCQDCVDRVMYGFDVEGCLTTHMTWWLVHAPYYEERHPIFARFVHQVIHEEIDDVKDEEIPETEFK